MKKINIQKMYDDKNKDKKTTLENSLNLDISNNYTRAENFNLWYSSLNDDDKKLFVSSYSLLSNLKPRNSFEYGVQDILKSIYLQTAEYKLNCSQLTKDSKETYSDLMMVVSYFMNK